MGSIPNGSTGDHAAQAAQGQGSSKPTAPAGSQSRDLPEALSPAVAGALEEGFGTLAERLALIQKHSSKEPRYKPLSEVGRGATGSILRVWDRVLQRELALKLVHSVDAEPVDQAQRASLDRRTARFIEEARITAQLDHPGIVPVHELAFDDQGHLFFAMPLVRGSTLTRIFEMVQLQEKGWTLRRAMDVLHKVCLTVAFAHSKGVVHRDLKPDNIMVGPYGESFVMDWGLALIQGRSEHSSFLGTPGYMAPEQVDQPHLVGPASDVYALGAILYSLLKGAMPHQATLDDSDSDFVDWSSLVSSAPRAIDPSALQVPPELVAICQRAMQPSIKERYPGALELAAEIERWMEGRVVQAHDTHGLTRLKKWSLRNRALAAAGGMVPVVLSLFLIQEIKNGNEVQAGARALAVKVYSNGLIYAEEHRTKREMKLAKDRLLECPESLRGWEWQHLMLQVQGGAQELVRAGGGIHSVAVGPQPGQYATGSDSGRIQLFRNSALQASLVGHMGAIEGLVFHPRDPYLVSASEDAKLCLWDVNAGSLVREFPGHQTTISDLALSADGAWLASGDIDGMLILRPMDDPGEHLQISTGAERLTALAFHPDGTELVVCSMTGRIRRWNLADAKFDSIELKVGKTIEDCRFSEDGKHLLVTLDREVLDLDPISLVERGRFSGHADAVTALALDPAGEQLLTGSVDGSLWLWDLESRSELARFAGHAEEVNQVAFLPDGRRFLSGSEDKTARIWLPGTQAQLQLGGHADWVADVAFDASGTRLASAARDGSLLLWDALDGSLQKSFDLERAVYGLSWPRGGDVRVHLGDAEMLLIDPDDGTQKQREFDSGKPILALLTHQGSGRTLGRYADNTICLWNPGEETPAFSLAGEETFNYSQAFHPAGDSFAIGLNDGRVSLRSSVSGERQGFLESARDSPIVSIAFSPDGERLAAGNVDRQIFIWELAAGRLMEVMAGHESQVTCLDFSPDGGRLVSGSVDRTVRLWEPGRGELLLTLRGHASAITSVRFDPHGTQIASASKDGVLRLWRAGQPGLLAD